MDKRRHMIEIDAQRQPYRIGDLYDITTATLVKGFSIFEPGDLKTLTTTHPAQWSKFEVTCGETDEDSHSHLKASGEFKLSTLLDLVNVGVSGAYTKDKRKGANETRVYLKYQCTTHSQDLTFPKSKRIPDDILDKSFATHIVAFVEYGINATFQFDRDISKTENKTEVEGQLKVMINKIPIISIEAGGKVNMTEEDKKHADKLSCKFYGNLILDRNPTTYEDAVRIYQNLPSYIDKTGKNAVAVRVMLCPLSVILSRKISEPEILSPTMVNLLTKHFQNVAEIVWKCETLLGTASSKRIDDFKRIHIELKSLVCELQQKYKTQVWNILQNNDKREVDLTKIMEMKFPLKLETIERWLEYRQLEANVLDALIDKLEGIDVSENESIILVKLIRYEKVSVLRLSLPLTDNNDEKFLQILKAAINETTCDKVKDEPSGEKRKKEKKGRKELGHQGTDAENEHHRSNVDLAEDDNLETRLFENKWYMKASICSTLITKCMELKNFKKTGSDTHFTVLILNSNIHSIASEFALIEKYEKGVKIENIVVK